MFGDSEAVPLPSLSDMTIVIATPVLDFGGIESHTVLHASGLLSIFGHVRVCTLADDGHAATELRRLGVTVDVLNTSPSVRNPLSTLRLWRYLQRVRPDVLHVRSGAMTVHGLVAGALAGIRVRIAEEVGIPNRGPAGRLIFPCLYRLASGVIGVSEPTVRFLVENDGVPEAKAVLIHNAIDDRYFSVERRPNPSGKRALLAVGRLVPIKGHSVLIRAAAPLLRENPQLVLQIAGDGPEREQLRILAGELGISSSVEFLGHRADVDGLLSSAEVYVLCSYSEGLPLSLVEATAARVPIVATAVGGVPEVVGNDLLDYLVQPGDIGGLTQALARVLDLPASERDALVERLHSHASHHFRSDYYVEQLSGLYLDFVQQAKKRRRATICP